MSNQQDDKRRTDTAFRHHYSVAVERAMSALGESAYSITAYLEKKYSMTLAETADDPKLLAEALDAAIDGGSRVIERRILRFLYEAIGIRPSSTMTTDFENRVASARQAYEEQLLSPRNVATNLSENSASKS